MDRFLAGLACNRTTKDGINFVHVVSSPLLGSVVGDNVSCKKVAIVLQHAQRLCVTSCRVPSLQNRGCKNTHHCKSLSRHHHIPSMWLQRCHHVTTCAQIGSNRSSTHRDVQQTRPTAFTPPSTRGSTQLLPIKTACRAVESTSQGAPHATMHRLASAAAAAALLLSASNPAWAEQLTLADVTPPLVQQGELLKRCVATHCPRVPVRQQPTSRREQAIISIFDRNVNSVVNIFDITLQVGMRVSPTPNTLCKTTKPKPTCTTIPQQAGQPPPQAVDAPEGNGTGFVFDTQGNIVTNYHVLGNVLRGLGPNAKQGARVARVALLSTSTWWCGCVVVVVCIVVAYVIVAVWEAVLHCMPCYTAH